MAWWRGLPAWSLAVGAALALTAIISAAPSDESVSLLNPISLGLILIVPVLVYLHRTVAAGLAVVLALVWLAIDQGSFEWWAMPTVVAFAALAVVLAWGRPAGVGRVVEAPSAVVAPPAPDGPLPSWRLLWTVAGVLAVAAIGGAWWAVRVQQEAVALDPDADATGWMTLPVIAGSVALAAGVRAFDRTRAVRRLFREPQPVRRLAVRSNSSVVTVVGQAGAVRFRALAVSTEGYDPAAYVYGDPAPGAWSTVVVDGRVRVPLGPGRLVEVPPASVDADGEIVLPEVPDELLTGEDRAPAPDAVRTYQTSAVVSWLWVGVAGLWLVGGQRWLSGKPWLVVLVVVAAAVALGLELGRRRLGRTQLAWNDAGIAMTTGMGRNRLAWSEVIWIHRHKGFVVLLTERGPLTISAGRRSRGGRRDVDQLWAALVDSCRRGWEPSLSAASSLSAAPPLSPASSLSTVEPPVGFGPRRSPALAVIWVVETAVLTAVIVWTGSMR